MATDSREARPGNPQFSRMQISRMSQRPPRKGHTLRQVQRFPGARWTRLPLSVRRASRPNLPQHSPWIQPWDYISHLRRQMERKPNLHRERPPRRVECNRGRDQLDPGGQGRGPRLQLSSGTLICRRAMGVRGASANSSSLLQMSRTQPWPARRPRRLHLPRRPPGPINGLCQWDRGSRPSVSRLAPSREACEENYPLLKPESSRERITMQERIRGLINPDRVTKLVNRRSAN